MYVCTYVLLIFFLIFLPSCEQAGKKLNEHQLASLSSEKAVNEYLENERESITNIIKQMLAIGEIFKAEDLQVDILPTFWILSNQRI